MDEQRIIHVSPFAEWYASQDLSARGVWVYDKTGDRKVLVEPPAQWGRHWSWNLTEDGKGVYFRRTGRQGAGN
jgi:hypothetical protein